MYCLSEILTFSHTFSCSDFPVACCRQPFLKWLCKGRNATRLISSQTSNANIRVSLKDSSKPRSVWLFSVDITRAACFFRILIYYTIVCGKPIVAQFKSSSSYERDRERVRDRQKEKDRKREDENEKHNNEGEYSIVVTDDDDTRHRTTKTRTLGRLC